MKKSTWTSGIASTFAKIAAHWVDEQSFFSPQFVSPNAILVCGLPSLNTRKNKLITCGILLVASIWIGSMCHVPMFVRIWRYVFSIRLRMRLILRLDIRGVRFATVCLKKIL